MPDIKNMIYDLLASDRIFNTTKAELHEYLAELQGGELDPADRASVAAMHRRIIVEKADHEPRRSEVESETSKHGEANELSAAEWKDRAYRTMERAKRAEARVLELERQLAVNRSVNSSDMFQDAKRQFARLYHPDSVKVDGIEKLVRGEIFKEFWSILEGIEKSGSLSRRA